MRAVGQGNARGQLLLDCWAAAAACWPGASCRCDSSLCCTARLAEFAEKVLFPAKDLASQDRLSKWQRLETEHPQLMASILQANPAWRAGWIANK